VEVSSLSVQILAILRVASRPALIAMWFTLVCFAPTAFNYTRLKRPVLLSSRRLYALATIVIAGSLNLFAALAPSTKIDELHYHMLLPSRIVADRGFSFYRFPWESAIVPQMMYQVLGAPLHALGLPDALNVVSWCFSLTLVWFGWYLLERTRPRLDVGYCFLAAILVGMYPAVWHVTGGAHALGDLALAAAVVLIISYKEFSEDFSSRTFAVSISVLCCAAAGSKITLLPIALILCTIGWFVGWQKSRTSTLFPLMAPWIAFFLPLCVWTFLNSGSPFGPILSGHFGSSAYAIGEANQIIRNTQAANQSTLFAALAQAGVEYSPLTWLGVAGFFLSQQLTDRTRIVAAILLLSQLVVIWAVLPHELRFLGGLHYGALIVFALFSSEYVAASSVTFSTAVVFAAIFPWLCVEGWYARPFVRVVTGRETATDFCREFVAFFDDYRRLDKILPLDAVLYVTTFRAPAVYSPRSMVFDERDLPHDRPIFLFTGDLTRDSIPRGFTMGQSIYFNPAATYETFRTPGRSPNTGTLHVIALLANPT
jgi:hypothetical protein